MSELQYGQEYLGLFLEELRQYFSDELIAKSCILERPSQMPTGNNLLGVDIARLGGDECAYAVLHKDKSGTRQVENLTKKFQLTTQTEENILALNKVWNTEKIGIDAGAGALGVGIFDRLMQNPLTKRKVIAMNNREISLDRDGKKKQRLFKEDLYDNLANMLEKGELKLLSDPEIALSLKSVQWELKEVSGQTKIRIFGNYTHIAEALIRAAYLAKMQKINKLQITYI